MLRFGFTKIGTWQTRKKQLLTKWPEYQEKRRMSSVIKRERTRLLDGHRGRHLWRLWVSGPSNGRDGSDKKGKMGAGYDN